MNTIATPDSLADRLVELAELPPKMIGMQTFPYLRMLEPSAGQGAILEALRRANYLIDSGSTYCCEIMPENIKVLKERYGDNINLREDDFLSYEPLGGFSLRHLTDWGFHRIIANPPSSKNQDIDHVCRMYKLLAHGGRLVSIMGEHWTFANEMKCQNFREWLQEVNAVTYTIEKGHFQESGTMVGGRIIVIDKT